MFATYTVYPIHSMNATKQSRKVNRVAAVEPTRAATPSWKTQYGNAGQTQRTYEMQAAQRDYIASLNSKQVSQAALSVKTEQVKSFTSQASHMEMPGSGPLVLEHRRPKTQNDGEYIRKYVQRLNEARDKTIRERQAHLDVSSSDRPPSAHKSALL